MTASPSGADILQKLDTETRELVRVAAVVAVGDESDVRDALMKGAKVVRGEWVDELLLQTYLFAGFPRALNAMREWRRVSGRVAPSTVSGGNTEHWRALGEKTCARVYGAMYDRLRRNIRHLHPELDEWMIVEGYGKVLSRPSLDLARRELCIVAVCAAAAQDRQLHSHLHGALNVGVATAVVDEVFVALQPVIDGRRLDTARLLWARVKGK